VTFKRNVLPPFLGTVVSSDLKLATARSSETSVMIFQATRRDIPEDCNRHGNVVVQWS
jgi:hypothetical protein